MKSQSQQLYFRLPEVQPDRVRILADFAERKDEIDLQQARAQLSKVDPASLDEMMRAQAKVDAATKAWQVGQAH